MKTKLLHQVVITSNENLPDLNKGESGIERFFYGYKHIVWSNSSIRELMLENGDLEELRAYDSLKPYAYKGDLAKYYLVYKFGGWAIDLNHTILDYPPASGDYEFIAFADIPGLTGSSWAVCCSLFYADKGHYILKNCIEQIVKNVDDNYYGTNALCPTGPNLFGSCIARFNLPENSKYLFGSLVQADGHKKFILNDEEWCLYKKNGLNPGNSGIVGGNSYVEMYFDRNVYENTL